MKCSLNINEDYLKSKGIISQENEIINKTSLTNYEENLLDEIENTYGISIVGNPFFFKEENGKSIVKLNDYFFNDLDELRQETIFKEQALDELDVLEEDNKQNEDSELIKKIDSMIASNEIQITCRI